MKWTDEQYTAIYARGKKVLVSAAAGSGKTAVLVERVLSRITRQNSPDSLEDLVILTFTNAAASEMRSRISEAIGAALAASPADRHLRGQLNCVQTARIMTIHSFCAKLARENFHMLGINPEFRIISGEEEETLKRETLAEYLETQYASADEASAFWELADNSSSARDDMGLWELIFAISRVLNNDSDPEGLAARFCDTAYVEKDIDAADTVWGGIFISSVLGELSHAEALFEKCTRLAANYGISKNPTDVLETDLDVIRNLAAVSGGWNRVREAVLGAKFGTLRFAKADPEDIKEEIKTLRDSAKKIVKSLSEGLLRFENEKVISDINANARLTRELLRLCLEFLEVWQNKKRDMGALGFDDLEHCALKILSVKENGVRRPSDFALEYGGKIREIMVDEYQDTNGVQDDIFECLSAGGAELFVVGDVKQSIYRFRNAEPDIFLRRRQDGVQVGLIPFGAGETHLEEENNTVIMQRNFRSLPQVTDAVNSVFKKLMVRDFAEMDYLRGDELVACRENGEEDKIAELVLIKENTSSEEEDDGGQSPSAREREAAWIAKRISAMIAEGTEIFDKSIGSMRAVHPGDFAILVRSAKRRVSVLAEALVAEGIPVSADAGGDIFGSVEVNAVMSMLSAVDNPGRELALAGYLRSPLVGFSAEDLGRVKMCNGGSFYSSLKLCAEGVDETAQKCRNALRGLEKMRLAASDLDVGAAVGMLLDISGAYVVFGSMDGGMTRRANLNLIAGLASSYTERGGRDLGGFVKSLERSRDHGDEFPAPKVAGEGVKIMTIHASKGLEFPVVFLANSMEKVNIAWKRENVMVHKDCGLGMTYSDAGSFIRHTTLPREAAAVRVSEQQLAEELRLLYVAMTRAREKLIITGCCNDAESLIAEVRNDGSAGWIKGICSKKACFGRWLLAALNAGEDAPVRVSFEESGKLVCDESKESREKVFEVDEELCREIERRTRFVYPHMKAADLPAKMTATGYNSLAEKAAESLKAEKEIALPSFMNKSGELDAAQRGVAVHLAMQLLPMRRYRDAAEAEAELGILESRGVLNSRQRSVISPKGVKAFYDSEIGSSVLKEDNVGVRREFKFSVLCPAEKFAGPDGAGEKLLLQGVIDLFWEDADGSVCIADYKTDNILSGQEEARAESYRSQLEVYKYALEEVLKKPVKGAYIWFFKTEKAVLVEF